MALVINIITRWSSGSIKLIFSIKLPHVKANILTQFHWDVLVIVRDVHLKVNWSQVNLYNYLYLQEWTTTTIRGSHSPNFIEKILKMDFIRIFLFTLFPVSCHHMVNDWYICIKPVGPMLSIIMFDGTA